MERQSTKGRRRSGTGSNPVRSVRVSDSVWAAAQRRAAYEGTTMSVVMLMFVEGYAQGLIDPPKVQVVYTPPRPAAAGV